MDEADVGPAPIAAARWWQFSLRWLFLAMALVAVFCAVIGRNWVRQRQIDAQLGELNRPGREALAFNTVVGPCAPLLNYPTIVTAYVGPEDKEFDSLPWDALSEVDSLSVEHPGLRDEHLARIARFPNLSFLSFICPPEVT